MPYPPTPQNILIYTLGELLGDGMVKLPFVQQLRALYPHAHITWMAGQRTTTYSSVLKPLIEKDLNEVHEKTMLGTEWKQALKSPWPQGYDLIIDTQRRIKATFCVKRLPHSTFISPAMKWFFSDYKPHTQTPWPKHFAAQHTILLEALTGRPHDLSYKVDIPKEYLERASDIRKTLTNGARKWALLAPGAGVRIRCWPLEKLAQLAHKLRSQGVAASYIIGPQDMDLMDELKTLDPQATFPLQKWGDKSIYSTLSLAETADVCLANDGGIGHVFGATHTPIVSLFGYIDPATWHPLSSHLTVIRGTDFSSDSGEVKYIPTDVVYSTIQGILNAR